MRFSFHIFAMPKIILASAIFQIFILLIINIPDSYSQELSSKISHESKPILSGCFHIAKNDINNPQLNLSPSDKKDSQARKQKDLDIQPIKADEFRQLLQAITPVKAKDNKSWGIDAIVSGSEFSLERLGILIDDVTILLVTLHTQQALARLVESPIENEQLKFKLNTSLEKLISCGKARFQGRGEEQAYNQTMRLVEQNQELIEPLIIYQLTLNSVRR